MLRITHLPQPLQKYRFEISLKDGPENYKYYTNQPNIKEALQQIEQQHNNFSKNNKAIITQIKTLYPVPFQFKSPKKN